MVTRILLRILLPAALVAALVYLLTGLIPKAYSSYQSLYFPLNPAGGIGALGPLAGAPSGGDAGAVPGLGGAISYPLIGSGSQTASGIINSHACRVEVAQALALPQRWHVSLLDATKRLSGAIIAETDRSGLLAIRVTAESPELCVAINQEIYKYLKRRTAELSANANEGNRRLVQQRLAAAETDLKKAQAQVVAVLQRSPLAAVGDVQKGYLDARKALANAKVTRDQERARLNSLEAEYRRLANAAGESGTVNALTTLNPAFAELAQELQRRRLELDDAMIAYSSTSARVYTARKAYENAQRISDQVKASTKTSAGVVSPEIIQARAEMAGLDETVRANEEILADSEKAAGASPKQYAESAVAREDFEAALARVSLLRQEAEKAAVIESRDPSRFEVVDEPYEDPTPVAPRRVLFAGVAFLLTAAACFVPLLVGMVRAAEASAAAERPEVAG